MFILSSVSSGLEFWSVNHISIDENSELKVFKNIILWGWGGVGRGISNNWPTDLLGTNVCETLESCC